jgi:uncharacterized membrane protein YdjX (TVP38/TMEM64 family)
MNWLYELAALFTIIVYFGTVSGWVKKFFAARTANRKRLAQKSAARAVWAKRNAWLMRRQVEMNSVPPHDPAMG